MDNRKKQKTYRFKLFNCLDVNSLREYLESMSEKGWIFAGCKGLFLVFEKGEPADRRYHVEMFHNGSFFESAENEEFYSYIGEMAAEGWEFIDANGRLYIFAASTDDAEIMQRAPADEFRVARKCIMSELIFLPILTFLCGWNFYSAFDTTWPTEFIEYGNFTLIWLFVGAFCVISFIRSSVFCLVNRMRISRGESVQYPANFITKCFNCLALALLALALSAFCANAFIGEISKMAILAAGAAVLLLVGILGMRFLWGGSGKGRQIIAVTVFSAAAVAVIMSMVVIMPHVGSNSRTIEYYDEFGDRVIEVVSDDVIPLTAEDIRMDTSELILADTSCDRYTSIFGTVTDCWQNYYKEYEGLAADLSYNIARVRFAWVKDMLVEKYMTTEYYGGRMEFEDVSEAEAELWGAERVWSTESEDGGFARLVVYEDAVLFISNSQVDFTEDVIVTVKTKLADELK